MKNKIPLQVNRILKDQPPIPPQIEAELGVARDRCRNSLYDTAKSILDYKDVNPRTHGEIIKCLESEHLRKMIIAPRGSLKSSVSVTANSIWRILNNCNERIFICSQLHEQSSTFIQEIRSHLEGPTMRLMYGRVTADQGSKEQILVYRTKVMKEPTVTAGGIGTVKVGQHYDTIICDDLNSPENSRTKERAEKVVQYYKYLLSILEPRGTLVITATRYSDLDLIGHILREELGIKSTQEARSRSGLFIPALELQK